MEYDKKFYNIRKVLNKNLRKYFNNGWFIISVPEIGEFGKTTVVKMKNVVKKENYPFDKSKDD